MWDFLPPPTTLFIFSLHFIWIVFLQPQTKMTPIQREQEMMSAARLSGCNQLWLVAAATFWEEHIKVLLLSVRVGEIGWGKGNYILTTNLLPTLDWSPNLCIITKIWECFRFCSQVHFYYPHYYHYYYYWELLLILLIISQQGFFKSNLIQTKFANLPKNIIIWIC